MRKFLLLLSVGLVFASASPSSLAQTTDDDITKAAAIPIGPRQEGQDDAQKLVPVIQKLRGFAVVILLIVLAVSAIAAAMGRTGMAISVAIGAIVLFGGFWVFSLIRSPLDGTDPQLTVNYQDTNAGRGTIDTTTAGENAPKPSVVLSGVMSAGLGLLATAVSPFIVIYGFWLAISFAVGSGDPSAVVNYLLGAIIAFAASLIGQIYNVF